MLKEPSISCSSRKQLISFITGLVFTAIIVSCLVLPKLVHAGESAASVPAALEIISADIPAEAEHQDVNETLSEEALIEELRRDVAAVAENRTEEDHWQVVRMRVTAYCPCSQCCGEFSDGITANNHHIQPGDTFVAADKTYPFETEMVIPGYNGSQTVKVMDRGGAIKGNRLDLFFHTHEAALEWGVQYLDVRIKAE